MAYPVNGAELARLLARDPQLGREGYNRQHHKFIQDEVRASLRAFGCPKQSSALRSDWVVDEEMARRVADALGISLLP